MSIFVEGNGIPSHEQELYRLENPRDICATLAMVLRGQAEEYDCAEHPLVVSETQLRNWSEALYRVAKMLEATKP